MGLDTSHDAWHGPYSAFNRWRETIAQAAGFPPLWIMDGFYEDMGRPPRSCGSWATDGQVIRYYEQGLLPLKWEDLGEHVGDWRLIPLLRHSDCDGEIPPEQHISIAEALEYLIPVLERRARIPGDGSDKPARADYDGAAQAARRFAAGLRRAAAAGEPLDFH